MGTDDILNLKPNNFYSPKSLLANSGNISILPMVFSLCFSFLVHLSFCLGSPLSKESSSHSCLSLPISRCEFQSLPRTLCFSIYPVYFLLLTPASHLALSHRRFVPCLCRLLFSGFLLVLTNFLLTLVLSLLNKV